MIRAIRACGALLLAIQLGPAASAQGIDDGIFARGQRPGLVLKAPRPPRKAPAPVPPGAKAIIGMNVGGVVQRITMEPPGSTEPLPGDAFEEEEPPAAPAPRMLDFDTWSVALENFDRILFDGAKEPARIEHLEALLAGRLDQEARDRRLDAEAREKLRLAGLGDIKRFFDLVEASRAEFEAARSRWATASKALQKTAALSELYQAGPFGDDSLFGKTLRTIGRDHPGPR